MTGMFDNTQPEFWDVINYRGETYGFDVVVTENETESLILGPDGKPLQYEQPQPFGFDLSGAAR